MSPSLKDLGEVDAAAAALEEGLRAKDARKCVNGAPCELALALADVLENEQKDVGKERDVFGRVCGAREEYDFADSEDLARCHAAWVELELRHENWGAALDLARRATSGRTGKKGSRAGRGLSRSLRLWNLMFGNANAYVPQPLSSPPPSTREPGRADTTTTRRGVRARATTRR